MADTSDGMNARRRAARAERRAFSETFGPFVREMQSAMAEYLRMRAAGVTREDACRGIEAVLRDVWPLKPTYFPIKCENCRDTGFQEFTCWSEHRCGRKRCVFGHPSHEHPYVMPCECEAGDRHRKRIRQVDEELAEVGRRKMKRRASDFTRVGQ